MSARPVNSGRICWPCVAGGMSMLIALAGTAYLALSYVF